MSPQEVLRSFCKLLRQKKINYLLTGGFAAGFYGFPRATHDIDFLVEVEKESIRKLQTMLEGLGKSFLVDATILDVNIQAPTLVTVFHFKSGLKIDFWIVEKKHFLQEWSRRREKTFLKQKIFLVSPEDLILTKLSWCKEIPSERHLRDCIGIWKVQEGKLDLPYLRQRAKKMSIEALMVKVAKEEY